MRRQHRTLNREMARQRTAVVLKRVLQRSKSSSWVATQRSATQRGAHRLHQQQAAQRQPCAALRRRRRARQRPKRSGGVWRAQHRRHRLRHALLLSRAALRRSVHAERS
jgi:hypothetical protein